MIINPYIFEVDTPKAVNGYLYNWYTMDGLAPNGMRIPSRTDWQALITSQGGAAIAGGKLKEIGFDNWANPNTGATNSSGFTGLGSNYRTELGVFLTPVNLVALFWTSTPIGGSAWRQVLQYDTASSNETPSTKQYGGSVRMVSDVSPGSTITDYEGRIYDIIQIGTQYWTVQNWACKFLDNGTAIPNVTDGTTWAGLTTLARCAYDNDENNV